MSRSLTVITIILFSLLMLALFSGLTWANMQFAQNHPGEKDFLVPWLAARTFLQYGNNPYDDPATQRAQIVYYGRLAVAGEDPLRLSVPFPLELFYFPLALITSYALARGLWMALLEVALMALGFLSLKLAGWKPIRTLLPVVVIFSVLWVYGYLPLVDCQAVILVALSLTGFLLALRDQRDELAGALLVLPLCKPDITGIFMLCFLWWIMDTDNSHLSRVMLRACRELGFEPHIRSSCKDFSVIIALVEAGLGVGVLPGLALLDRPVRARVRPISPPLARRLSSVIRPERRSHPMIVSALAELERFGASYVPEFGGAGE